MKRLITFVLVLSCVLGLIGCSQKRNIENTIDGNMKTYYEMSDGTWQCDDVSYKYRLEITGRLNNADCDTSYVYLSNIETITFEQAWKASGLSSNTNDYFPVEDAILVELNQCETEIDNQQGTGSIATYYEAPDDEFCYSADGTQTYELSADDRQYVINLLNNASWIDDFSNCASDFIFYTQHQEIQYHSDCGTFNDYTNKRCTTVSEEQRNTINSMLGINRQSEQDYYAVSKSAMIVLDNGAEETAHGNEAFSMVLDDNISLQNSMELSGNNLYWQIKVENTGNGIIVVEVDGDVHKVEAGKTVQIYSTSQWSAGIYTVSFASILPDTMQGTAVCTVTDSID